MADIELNDVLPASGERGDDNSALEPEHMRDKSVLQRQWRHLTRWERAWFGAQIFYYAVFVLLVFLGAFVAGLLAYYLPKILSTVNTIMVYVETSSMLPMINDMTVYGASIAGNVSTMIGTTPMLANTELLMQTASELPLSALMQNVLLLAIAFAQQNITEITQEATQAMSNGKEVLAHTSVITNALAQGGVANMAFRLPTLSTNGGGGGISASSFIDTASNLPVTGSIEVPTTTTTTAATATNIGKSFPISPPVPPPQKRKPPDAPQSRNDRRWRLGSGVA